jgi:hypothetical protein
MTGLADLKRRQQTDDQSLGYTCEFSGTSTIHANARRMDEEVDRELPLSCPHISVHNVLTDFSAILLGEKELHQILLPLLNLSIRDLKRSND